MKTTTHLHVALTLLALIVLNVESQCPPIDPNFPGSCLSLCDDDSECLGEAVCCSNGCGFSCVAPESNGTSVGAKSSLKKAQENSPKTTASVETVVKDSAEEETITTEQQVKTIRTTTEKSVTQNKTGSCINGSPLKHNDGNILVCGFAAGDFACPTTHTCVFERTKGKFVCCPKEGTAVPAAVSESQVNPCPDGEPFTNAVGGKFTCSGSAAAPCPQGAFCIAGVCCPIVSRPFSGQAPVDAVGNRPDFSQKAGQCPVAQAPGAFSNCQTECRFDSECLGSTKCCFTGCASRCTEPIPFGLNPNLPFNPNSIVGGQGPPPFGGFNNQQQPPPPAPPPPPSPALPPQQPQTFGPQFFNNAQTSGLPLGFVPPREGFGQFQRPNNEEASRQFANAAPSVFGGQRQIAPLPLPGPAVSLPTNLDNRPTIPLFNNNNNNNNPEFRPPPFVAANGEDRRNTFPFAPPVPPANNFANNLNVPNQPILNTPAQTIGFVQPGVQTLPQARSINAEQFSLSSPVQIPVPNPDFVPFPNAPFSNIPRQVNNENFFPFAANRRAVEPRRDTPARLEQQQRLTVERIDPVPEQKISPSNELCANVQCPPCHHCNAEKSGTTKCVRSFDCCPDGTVPLGCDKNPCQFASCRSHPTATCVADSCGVCKAAFFDAEGNNVSCV